GDFVGHGLRRKLNSKETRKGHSHNKANDNQPSQQAGQNKDVATTSIFSNARYHIPSCRPKKDALRWCDYWYERICDIRASESDSIRICTAPVSAPAAWVDPAPSAPPSATGRNRCCPNPS